MVGFGDVAEALAGESLAERVFPTRFYQGTAPERPVRAAKDPSGQPTLTAASLSEFASADVPPPCGGLGEQFAGLHLIAVDGLLVEWDSGFCSGGQPDQPEEADWHGQPDRLEGIDRTGRLRAILRECEFPQHVVEHLAALVPVLAGGVAGSGPAVGAFTGASPDHGAGEPTTTRPEGDSRAPVAPVAPVTRVTPASAAEEDAAPAWDAGEDATQPGAEGQPGPALASGAWWLSGQVASRATDDELIKAVDAALVLSRWSDALLVGVVADLTAATGEKLMDKRAAADPAELSVTGRERWRKKTKSAMAHELQVLTGWGIQDCHDRVALATGPRIATTTPWQAWAAGQVQWNQVRAWWSTCRQMPVEVAAQVAKATFGEESERVTSARAGGVDPDDMARQGWGETKDVLDRLAAALLGNDPARARADRQAAVSRRDARAQVEDDGTGCLTITGRTTSIVAAIQRIDQAARALRAAGDPRTLSQLRADLGLSLLIHGRTGSAPDSASATEGVDPTDVGEPRSGGSTSAVTRNNLVTAEGARPGHPPGASFFPDSLNPDGVFVTPHRASDAGGTRASSQDGSTEEWTGPHGPAPDWATLPELPRPEPPRPQPPPPDPPRPEPPPPGTTNTRTSPRSGTGAPGDVVLGLDEASARILAGAPRVNLEVVVPLDVLVNPHSTGVGMVPGHGYLSGEATRELAARAGGVMHRLVTDPLDGHLIERTVKSYRPDAEMRAFTEAADRHCRAPGCTVPAETCDFDHVQAHSEGGATSAANGLSGHRPHHQLKTWDVWRAKIDGARRVTWTTLFGACYTTRTFDYGTLTHPATGRAALATGAAAEMEGARERFEQAVGGDADLQDRLIYAALAHRDRSEPLAAEDDYFDPEDRSCGPGWVHRNAPIQLRYRTHNGQRGNGPPPDQPTPEDILGLHPQSEDDAQSGDYAARSGDDGQDEDLLSTEPPPPF